MQDWGVNKGQVGIIFSIWTHSHPVLGKKTCIPHKMSQSQWVQLLNETAEVVGDIKRHHAEHRDSSAH